MTPETLLLRQVHPSFVQDGRVTSQAFRPTLKDENLLSFYDGDMIKPEPAWEHYTRRPDCHSVGVMGVTVAECADLDLLARPDPDSFPEHTVIDFSAYSKSQIEKKAKQLRAKAAARDWLYRTAVNQ
ncbi:MAG: hypothetical protein HQL55_12260 [Magnetococcales bacterium]|nr:hypothetical protein [Magnetococcales bacterium]